MKIKRLVPKNHYNPNGFVYDQETLNSAIAEYNKKQRDLRLVQYIEDYSEIKGADKYFAINTDKVMGTVIDIDDEYVDIDFFDEYKDINPLLYRTAFRMIGKTKLNNNNRRICLVEKIIAIDLVKN